MNYTQLTKEKKAQIDILLEQGLSRRKTANVLRISHSTISRYKAGIYKKRKINLEKKYDILGTQELTMRFTRKVDKYLKEFNFYGDYQYGRGIIGKYFPLIKTFNQGNQIITHMPVESTRTRTLPWIPYSFKELWRALKKPSLERRIVTRIEIETEKQRIYILNTHFQGGNYQNLKSSSITLLVNPNDFQDSIIKKDKEI